jgi:hypothetical protein
MASNNVPEFRFAQMRVGEPQQPLVSAQHHLKPPPHPHAAAAAQGSDVIDKNEFFGAAAYQEEKASSSNWVPTTLRPVPAFYPLEKSSRLVEDADPKEIARRLSDCLRSLSVQAIYNNDTASLLTAENVEMHLSLWKTPSTAANPGVVVELQRRKGDSIAFHRYSRSILDAAVEDSIPSEAFADDIMYSKKVQRLMQLPKNQETQEHENAIIAIEIAHGLIMKDRMDARVLGLESLCLLTDPRKTGYITAVLASHVVLLGSTRCVEVPGAQSEQELVMDEGPFQEIREAILGLVQFSRIGEVDDQDDSIHQADAESMMLLHNLALAVLANSLDVMERSDRFDEDFGDTEPEDTKPRSRLRTASSNDVANEFLQQTEEFSNKEILSTLIAELGKAQLKPHDATLSAKCLGSLLRASDEAKKRAQELGAKQVVSTALDVGVRTHRKLETECEKVVKVLTRTESETELDRNRRQEEGRGDNE